MKPFKISHSKVKLGRRCLKAYQYKYVDKVRKRVKSRALIVGSLVHSCIESHFRNGSYMPEIIRWKEQEFNRMFKEEQALHADIVPLVKTLIRGYLKAWDSRGLTPLWVEKDFEVEIAPGIILIGKIDMLAECDKGRRWLVEHKTCKKMPGEEVRIFDTQAILYGRVLPLMGEGEVTGVVWDYVRTKLPARPELLAKGGLSTRRNIDTTPEVYLREIKKHGLDPRGYKDILGELETKRDNFYREVRLPLNQSMTNRIFEELVITGNQLKDLEVRHSQGEDCFARNLTRDCSWCDYNTLCHAELRGDDTEYLLKHDYIVRKEDDSKEIEVDSIEG